MISMKNNQTLLRLVRIGSGLDSAISDTILPDSPNWQTLYPLALHQGVSAILLDAIGLLPSETRPPKPVLMQWICQATMMELMYAKHRERIVELADFYNQNGIRMLLLKGYGCSLCYPKPEHRPTGDLDVYLFGKQEEADILVEKQLGIKVHREYHKHSTFKYGGVEVENHAKFIDDVSHKSNIRFEQILMSVLDKEECLPSPIDNVLLPSSTFNALFLLRHTGEHFASNEITLRHVLDVGTFSNSIIHRLIGLWYSRCIRKNGCCGSSMPLPLFVWNILVLMLLALLLMTRGMHIRRTLLLPTVCSATSSRRRTFCQCRLLALTL